MDIFWKKPERLVKKVFIHCTAISGHKYKGQKLKDVIHRIHVIENGWSDIGYHGLIDGDGVYIPCRDYNKTPAAQRGHNSQSLAFSLDGLKKDDFNQKQFATLLELARKINLSYDYPITYHGHREVSNKLCPVFNYKEVLGLDDNGIMSFNPNIHPLKDIEDSTIGQRTLKITHRGDDVRTLQRMLGDITVDGVFGQETKHAVMDFQSKHNLEVDGIVGPITWSVLLDQ